MFIYLYNFVHIFHLALIKTLSMGFLLFFFLKDLSGFKFVFFVCNVDITSSILLNFLCNFILIHFHFFFLLLLMSFTLK